MKSGMRALVAVVGLAATCAHAQTPTEFGSYSDFDFDMKWRVEGKGEAAHCTGPNGDLVSFVNTCTDHCGPIHRGQCFVNAAERTETHPTAMSSAECCELEESQFVDGCEDGTNDGPDQRVWVDNGVAVRDPNGYVQPDMALGLRMLDAFTPVFDTATCNSFEGDELTEFTSGIVDEMYTNIAERENPIISCVSAEDCVCPREMAKICFWYIPCIPEIKGFMPAYECSGVCDAALCECPDSETIDLLKEMGKNTEDENISNLFNPMNRGEASSIWNSRGETQCQGLRLLENLSDEEMAVLRAEDNYDAVESFVKKVQDNDVAGAMTAGVTSDSAALPASIILSVVLSAASLLLLI